MIKSQHIDVAEVLDAEDPTIVLTNLKVKIAECLIEENAIAAKRKSYEQVLNSLELCSNSKETYNSGRLDNL